MADKKIGGRIVLDGADQFTRDIRNINSSYKTLQSESRMVSAEFKDNANSAEALRAKHNNLSEQIKQQNRLLETYGNALNTSQNNLQKCADNVNNWKEKVAAAERKLEELRNSTSATNEEIQQQEEELQRANSGLRTAENQYDSVNRTTERYQSCLNDTQSNLYELNRALEQNDRYLEEAENSTDGCATSIDNLGREISDTEDDASTFGEVLKANLASEAIIDCAKALASTIKDAGAEMIEFSTSSKTALNKLVAQTGASEEETKKFGDTMKEVYSDNFGESMEDIGDAMAVIKQNLRDMNAEELKKVTENAYLLRDTFDFDMQEQMRAVNMLMKQFGISSDEAFTLIAEGAQKGLNKNDDLLDTINEYSVQFESMGYSAEEMFNMLVNGAEDGTFSVDKLGDAVKEMGIRLKDGTADDVLKQIGLDADEVKAKVNSGGEVAKSAISSVMSKLQGLSNDTERYVAYQTIFGSMFEDLGESGVNALMNVQGSISATTNTLEKMNSVRYDDLGSTFEGIKRQVEMKVEPTFERLAVKIQDGAEQMSDDIAGLVDGGVNVLVSSFEWVTKHGEEVKSTLIAVGAATTSAFATKKIISAVTAFKTLKAAIMAAGAEQSAFSVLLSKCPTEVIVGGIAALTVGLGKLFENLSKGTEEEEKFVASMEDISSNANDVKDSINATAKEMENSVSQIKEQDTQASHLITRLFELNSAQNKSKEETSEMADTVRRLNALYPNLNLQIDNNTGKLNMNKESVLKVTDAYKKQAIAEAYNTSYTELLQSKISANQKYKETIQQVTEKLKESGYSIEDLSRAHEILNKIKEQGRINDSEDKEFFQKMQEVYGGNVKQIISMIDAIDDSKSANDDAEKKVKELEESMKAEGIAIDSNTSSTKENTKANKENTTSNIEVAESEEKIAENAQKIVDGNTKGLVPSIADVNKAQDLLKDKYQEIKDSAKESLDSQIDMWHNAKGEEAKTLADINKNLDNAYKARVNREKNLEKVRKNCSKDTYDYVCGLTDDEVAVIAKGNAKQLKDFEKKYNKVKEVDKKIATDMANAGTEGGKKYIQNAEKQLNNTNGLKSKGKNISKQVADGISANAYLVKNAAANLGSGAKAQLQNSTSGHTYAYGKNFAQGFANGITGNVDLAIRAAGRLGTAALSQLQNSINSHSPSRETMKIGGWFDDGFIGGMESKKPQVISTASSVGKAALNGLNGVTAGGVTITGNVGNTGANVAGFDYEKMADVIISRFANTNLKFDRTGVYQIVDSRLRRVYV